MRKPKVAILLAAGSGSRLQPFTYYTSKHLLPVDDVPMIFYPLKNLQLIGVKKVFLIINEEHLLQWEKLIASYDFGMDIVIVVQNEPLGIPHAIACCEASISGSSFLVALGDNLIIASNFLNTFKEKIVDEKSATICGFRVSDPRAFGVPKFDVNGDIISVVEKPNIPPSQFAIAGFYQFPTAAFEVIKNLKFSNRGELEIVDLINYFIDRGLCDFIESESASDYWIDTGTNESLVLATNFVRDLKKTSGASIARFQKSGEA